jgi:hypothetical protein
LIVLPLLIDAEERVPERRRRIIEKRRGEDECKRIRLDGCQPFFEVRAFCLLKYDTIGREEISEPLEARREPALKGRSSGFGYYRSQVRLELGGWAVGSVFRKEEISRHDGRRALFAISRSAVKQRSPLRLSGEARVSAACGDLIDVERIRHGAARQTLQENGKPGDTQVPHADAKMWRRAQRECQRSNNYEPGRSWQVAVERPRRFEYRN